MAVGASWGRLLADVISRGVQVHQQPGHMLLGGSVMWTEMHGSRTEHSRSRLAPLPTVIRLKEGWSLLWDFLIYDFIFKEAILSTTPFSHP